MVIENEFGRVVGLPEHMEEAGFRQARRVISISSNLMAGREPYERVRSTTSSVFLRDQILAKFPDVITDEEYYEGVIDQDHKEVVEAEASAKTSPTNVVSDVMTKAEIVEMAEMLDVSLKDSEKRLRKSDLIDLVNERYKG